MSGSYLLLFYFDKDKKIGVGKLGEFIFKKGYYVYVGSYKYLSRIQRHLSKNKKYRWHIDYVLEHSYIFGVILKKEKEKDLACKLKDFYYIEGFGSSDSKCISHLFYFNSCKELFKKLWSL